MDLGLIFAITQGLSMLLSLFQPSQSKLMEKQGEVTVDTQKKLMKERLRMAQGLGIQPPYQSPYLGEADSMIAKALAANMGRTANWGWPAGQNINTDFMTQALSNMAKIPSQTTGASVPAAGNILSEPGFSGLITPGGLRRA